MITAGGKESSFLFCFGIRRELISLSVQFSECMNSETIQGVFVTLFFLTSSSLNGQISCSGTFGDNIFENGDFGSGPEVIYPEDPEIAPGYIYTVHTPPEDGYYTLTNDMGQWLNNHTTWINISDRSDDPQGYMMVVNASEEPGIFYEQTIENLCPNTVYEFSVDVINIVRREAVDHIKPELEFLIDGESKHTTGKIPQDESWHKHGFTFSIDPEQTSVTLTLVNNAPGGLGNDLALDNITFRPCGSDEKIIDDEYVSFCQDETEPAMIRTSIDTNENFIQWQYLNTNIEEWQNVGQENQQKLEVDVTNSGERFYRIIYAKSQENLENPNCRFFSELVTAEVIPLEYEVWDTICDGDTRTFDGSKLTAPGTYVGHFTSSLGCDSIVTLYLSAIEKIPIDFELEIDDPSCYNFSNGKITIDKVEGGYPPYIYAKDTDTSSLGSFSDLEAGEKLISVIDRYGCTDQTTVILKNPPVFEMDSLPDHEVVLGEVIHLEISGNEPIQFLSSEPDIFDNCSDCVSISFLPTQSGKIQISAENRNGCISEQSFFVDVETEDLPLEFPNAFSPNGDGINEEFEIIARGQAIHKIISVKILDRWGNQIHQMENVSGNEGDQLWDGTMNGQLVDPGMYVFVCEVELINGETKKYSGEIHLLR